MDAVEFLKTMIRMRKIATATAQDAQLQEFEDFVVSDMNPEEVVEKVENWAKTHPVINLSEDQKTAIRGRIAEGDKWAITWKGVAKVCFSEEKPFLNGNKTVFMKFYRTGDRCFYNFLKDGVPVYLPDLLGGEE